MFFLTPSHAQLLVSLLIIESFLFKHLFLFLMYKIAGVVSEMQDTFEFNISVMY